MAAPPSSVRGWITWRDARRKGAGGEALLKYSYQGAFRELWDKDYEWELLPPGSEGILNALLTPEALGLAYSSAVGFDNIKAAVLQVADAALASCGAPRPPDATGGAHETRAASTSAVERGDMAEMAMVRTPRPEGPSLNPSGAREPNPVPCASLHCACDASRCALRVALCALRVVTPRMRHLTQAARRTLSVPRHFFISSKVV